MKSSIHLERYAERASTKMKTPVRMRACLTTRLVATTLSTLEKYY